MNRRAPADGPGALSVSHLPALARLARATLVSPPRIETGRLRLWIAGGLGLFVWGLYTSLTAGVNPLDEAWFLQVANRITHGDVLYRDVFFGATPLSVYLTLPFVAFFGVEILAVKLLAVIGFVLAVLLCCRIAGQLGLPRRSLLLLVPALLVFAPPPATALYQPLANLFLIGCFSAALDLSAVKAGRSKPISKPALVSAGASAGLAFASKQDIGLYVLAALLLAVGAACYRKQFDRPALWASIAAVLAAFVCAALLAVLPIWLSGGAEKFLEYGFTNKGTYLRLAGVSYLDGLTQLASALAGPLSLDAVRELIPQLAYLLPPITLGALAAAWLAFRRERDRIATICCFAGAAVLGMFPRADLIHVTFGIPAVLIGLVYAWQQFRAMLPNVFGRMVQSGIVLVLGLWLLSSGVDPLARAAHGELAVSTLPHFGGILLPAD